MCERRRPSRLWIALAEAPYLPVAAYLSLSGWMGIFSGFGITPSTVQVALPTWLTMAWTVGIAVGGALATLGALAQRTRIESAGLGLLLYGAALYGAVIAVAAWPEGVMVVAVSAAVSSMCLIRMRVLALARHAQEVAGQIVADQEGH